MNPIKTVDLLKNNYCCDEIIDKVYLCCEISPTPQGWRVDLCSEDPVVWLNDSFKEKYGTSADYTVKQLQKREGDNKSLLSAGAFLFYDGKLVVLKRDERAPSYAGALTEPAGRCAELPLTTVLKELNEELLAQDLSTVYAFIHSIDMEEPLYHIRVQQLAAKNMLDFNVGPAYLKPVKTKTSNIVEVYLDGVFCQRILGCSAFIDKDNTLEVRQAFTLVEPIRLSFLDGEPYSRGVEILALNNLKHKFCCACLESFVANEA